MKLSEKKIHLIGALCVVLIPLTIFYLVDTAGSDERLEELKRSVTEKAEREKAAKETEEQRQLEAENLKGEQLLKSNKLLVKKLRREADKMRRDLDFGSAKIDLEYVIKDYRKLHGASLDLAYSNPYKSYLLAGSFEPYLLSSERATFASVEESLMEHPDWRNTSFTHKYVRGLADVFVQAADELEINIETFEKKLAKLDL